MNELQDERLKFVRKRILQIRAAILENPPGVTSISREGFAVGYSTKMANCERQSKKDMFGRRKRAPAGLEDGYFITGRGGGKRSPVEILRKSLRTPPFRMLSCP